MAGFESARPRDRDRARECSTSGRSVAEQVFDGQRHGTQLTAGGSELLFARAVRLLQEREFPCGQWRTFDKAFACAWLSERQVVVGTKCNRLLLLDAEPRRSPSLPLLQEVPLPPPPARPPALAETAGTLSPVRSALWTIRAQMSERSSGSSHGAGAASEAEQQQVESVAGMIARAMAALEQPHTPPPGQFATGPGGVQVANCGIHSISLSPDGSLLASGGARPSDCQVFAVQPRPGGGVALQPRQTLVGHRDWLFGSAWVTDRHIVTGSRDRCLKLWCVDAGSSEPNLAPLQTRPAESGKVRDVKWLPHSGRVASLTVDGTVHLWDAHLQPAAAITTPHEREVVCLATAAAGGELLGVGSQNHVCLVDARLRGVAAAIPNADHNHGVRSLAFCRGLLSVGGGQGRLRFCDLRTRTFLPAGGGAGGESARLQTGAGHLLRNQVYLDHFEGMEVRNACYAHAWDPSCSRLLAVGGPLAFGLTGCYMGLWE